MVRWATQLLALLVLAAAPYHAAAADVTFTVAFTAGPNGTLGGVLTQTVPADSPSTPVSALPDSGYHFQQWTRDGVPFAIDNPLTIAAVGADMAFTAEFAPNLVTVTYTADANGGIGGASPQTLTYGSNAAAVEAVPASGFHFVRWILAGQTYSTANPLTVANVTADMALTAEFAADSFTVRFEAGPNGVIAGAAVQVITAGGDAAPVTALADSGSHFVRWLSAGTEFSRENPLTVPNVSAALVLTAEFAVDTYAVTFTAGANGTLAGAVEQTLVHGGTAEPVTAVPDTGSRFVRWTLNGLTFSTSNPLTLTGVTGNLAVSAEFALNTYTVTFLAGANGGLRGAVRQVVAHGAGTSLVTAVPNTGHHFVRWLVDETPYSEENPLALPGITADVTLTAEFAVNTYAVGFLTGPNGGLVGTTSQTVSHWANAEPVAAVPVTGYHFVGWNSNGMLFSTENPITVKSVTASLILTAEFAVNTYTVTFTPGAHGGLEGVTTQTVAHGGTTSVVEAVPDNGYHFVRWTLGGALFSETPAVVLSNVTGTAVLTAEFEINSYTVAFAAGDNGTVVGTLSQTVTHGATTLAVTAQPAVGYHFVRWVQGANHFSTGNPLVVANVVADMALTAEFALSVYPVTFTPGSHGSVAGLPAQMIEHGHDAQPVTAVATVGYHFLRWTIDGEEYSRDNPITVLNVAGPMALLAEFEINTYAVNFTAAQSGMVSGPTPQAVTHGSNTTAVTAVPPAGHHFLRWTKDGEEYSSANPLTVTNVTADMTLTAEFEVNIYTVTFVAGAHGRLVGETVQRVAYLGSTTAVEAVADLGYMFDLWSDGFALNPRQVGEVRGDMTVTAQFRDAQAVPPAGAFLARVDRTGVTAGRGLWDLSGSYQTQVAGNPLALALVHSTKGKITGTGTFRATASTGEVMDIPVSVKGTTKGSGGAVTVSLSLAGKMTGIPANPRLSGKVSIGLTLTLDVGDCRLLGAAVVKQKIAGVSTTTPAYCDIAIPEGTDGTYEILFELVQSSSKMTGTAVLTLSNGADYLFTVKGTYPGAGCNLTLKGHSSDTPAKAISATTFVVPLEGNAARLQTFKASGYGQKVAW